MTEAENDKWRHTRFIAWAALKPWSKDMQPSDLIKLPDDEERLKEHYTKLKAEGKLATVRKQTPEEKELMKRIRNMNRKK